MNHRLEVLEIRLRQFIRKYVPKSASSEFFWKEPIGSVDFVPYFTDEELEIISNGKRDFEREFKWYVLEAIREFQQNGHHKDLEVL